MALKEKIGHYHRRRSYGFFSN